MGIPNEAMYGDDRADSMPHVMPVHLTSPSANLDSHMNSYVGGKLAVAVPPNKVLPAVPLSKQQMFPRVKTLAPKKPDGLHQVSALLDSIKSIYTEAAELVKEVGMLKTPVMKQIGRTNVILKDAVKAKKTILNDFGTQPSLSDAEKTQVVDTYNQLLVNLQQQVALLQKEADQLLTPIQLNVNQTVNDIARLNTEIAELHRQTDALLYLADQFNPEAMTAARTIEEDTAANYASLQS